MKTFGMKTVIHFGDNALDRLREIPYKRVLIITDPFVVQSKMIDLITEPLAKGGIEYDIFSNVVPDAPVDKIADGVKKFLSYQPEAVIAVGGGSAQGRIHCPSGIWNSSYAWRFVWNSVAQAA